jgi:hypothetical protein
MTTRQPFIALLLVCGVTSGARALPCGTLQGHEQWGGHTIARHVGKSASDLKARITSEGVSSASTFATEGAADTAITAGLTAQSRQVSTWVAQKSGPKRLAVKVKTAKTTGISATSSAPDRPHNVTGVTVVLQRAKNVCGYKIVTAYPTNVR